VSLAQERRVCLITEWIILAAATLALLGSPGPAPMALAASGAAYGWLASLRFYAGVMSAFVFALTLTANGAMLILQSLPGLAIVLMLASVAYLLWLAWRIASAAPAPAARTEAGALRFVDGVLINIANPKLYAGLAALLAGFMPSAEPGALGAFLASAVIFICAASTNLMWMLAGSALARLFRDPRANRMIRVAFAALIVLSSGLAIYNVLA
jgi:threonine/homoserine/homoserine lactone efflux protein